MTPRQKALLTYVVFLVQADEIRSSDSLEKKIKCLVSCVGKDGRAVLAEVKNGLQEAVSNVLMGLFMGPR
jgi:hypothetical protein